MTGTANRVLGNLWAPVSASVLKEVSNLLLNDDIPVFCWRGCCDGKERLQPNRDRKILRFAGRRCGRPVGDGQVAEQVRGKGIRNEEPTVPPNPDSEISEGLGKNVQTRPFLPIGGFRQNFSFL